MQVKIVYSETQLDECVKFISKYNENFIGEDEYIRSSINAHMLDMVLSFPNLKYSGTMGYYLVGEIEEIEGVDHDSNILMIEIQVDPALCKEHIYTEKTFNLKIENGIVKES